ncbi:XTP/dITP diphosphatase [Clostridium fallax]|uniref:dITP/XTP pyrophosphatase n=1 Tax=Clostridium fallax TaxID=1533 RepID=A0A1M4YWG9_9CLOT|nr:XTP/dITP diphosphatase [Clostridium fallax]SHF10080.1 XTP/dITP diphosphohydrolase [Clostridium fallax]SQB22266.1 deoxyribonucleotide triphosphate pyrophosphatase [Clostridium fallax]
MKKLIVASNNEHKIREIKEILKDLPLKICSLKEEGINIDVEEDGKTFMENSYKKAYEIVEYLKKQGKEHFMVMADDSGLMVDYLNGEPGVYSARYAGEHGNSKKNNEKLLEKLNGVPFEERTAAFVCAVVILTSEGKEIKVEGKRKGNIIENPKGFDGFGYDPLFYVPEFKMTFAEMSGEKKNSISHRGKALELVKEELKDIL